MPIGQNIPNDSAFAHVTGTSVFIDDRPFMRNEVLVGVVGATQSSGIIRRIDFSRCLAVKGVLGVFTAQDLHHNRWGTIKEEQPLLVLDKIGYFDEPVCLIAYAPEYPQSFLQAKKLVSFEIEKITPVLTIEDALEKSDIIYAPPPVERGNFLKSFIDSPNKLEGEFFIKGQEHFYMESQAAIAYPMENGQLEVHSSSQHPSETQRVCAHALGLKLSDVTCIVKRMGGGFGGKESQASHFAGLAALVAYKLQRPARLCLTKDDDMMMTGKRHPFKNSYQVGFSADGEILALKLKLIADGGAYTDLTPSILDRAVFHSDGSYYLENVFIEGIAVRTNNQSHTAFRGFGGPQGNLLIESIIEDMAIFLKKDAFAIRRINLYEGVKKNTTPYGQVLTHNTLPEIFDTLYKESEYQSRLSLVQNFNLKKSGKIRGLSMTGCKFGIAFTTRFLNQGTSIVNVHLDGTVQISTGATEMGQGVNTKIQQIAAHAFGIPAAHVRITSTSTEKNHNTSPTAASSGADINGAATLKACQAILNRLRWVAHLHFSGVTFDDISELPGDDTLVPRLDNIQFKNGFVEDTKTNKSISWSALINIAYLNRIHLGEYAFFKTEGLGFDKKTGKGVPFKYFTTGAALSEVEIDECTGEMKVIRTDILMDLGRSLNPGIDQGQVIGAFIQGVGWLTTENLVYNAQGKLLSYSPTTYKIPNIQDIPRTFNVKLLENNHSTENVHRSKAVGEPPLLLGASVWTAIKHALSFRSKSILQLSAPATAEVILMELSRGQATE